MLLLAALMPLAAGVPVVVSIAVVTQFYKIEVTGLGTVEVETRLHTTSSTPLPNGAATESTLIDVRDDRRLTLTTASTAETVVSDGNTLSHTVSLGTALLNHNCAVGIYTSSTDTAADAGLRLRSKFRTMARIGCSTAPTWR